jgi:hypothetical protein
MSLRDQMMAALQLRMQQQQQADQSALAAAQHQPIPGLTGPTSSGGIPGQPTVGMAPPQQPLPSRAFWVAALAHPEFLVHLECPAAWVRQSVVSRSMHSLVTSPAIRSTGR